MEQLLGNLLGSQQQKQDYGDFAKRYQNGHPSEGYSDEEVTNRYQQVAAKLPPDQFEKAAQQSFAKLSPQERKQFMQWLKHRNGQQQQPHPHIQQHPQEEAPSAGALAGLLGGMQQQQPNMLTSLLTGATGGQSSGIMGNPIAKAALAGIVANATKGMLG